MTQAAPSQGENTGMSGSALQRKTRVGQEVRQTYTMSLAKALRLSLAKVADTQMGLAVAVIGATVAKQEQDGLGDVFGDDGLLMLLDGPAAQRGAVMFDADLVGGLIQQQTMGKVTAPFESGAPSRSMTDTDAAICAPYIDGFLARAAKLPDAPEDRDVLEGYSFGARVSDTRLLLMALEQPKYHVIQLTVDVAGGARQGKISLCLPFASGAQGHGVDDLEGETGGLVPKAEPVLLDKTVLALHVDLHVALTSLTMPLGRVQKMAEGDVFDLGITAFNEASVQTVEGRRLGAGVLGQINGMRALQLEHSRGEVREPRRRKTDRADLDLPNVSGDGTGTQNSADGAPSSLEGQWQEGLPEDTLDGMPATVGLGRLSPLSGNDASQMAHQTDMPALPDMSDLEGFDGLPDLPDLPSFEDGPDMDGVQITLKSANG